MYKQNVVKKKWLVTFYDPDVPGEPLESCETRTVEAESETSAVNQIPKIYKVVDVQELNKEVK